MSFVCTYGCKQPGLQPYVHTTRDSSGTPALSARALQNCVCAVIASKRARSIIASGEGCDLRDVRGCSRFDLAFARSSGRCVPVRATSHWTDGGSWGPRGTRSSFCRRRTCGGSHWPGLACLATPRRRHARGESWETRTRRRRPHRGTCF